MAEESEDRIVSVGNTDSTTPKQETENMEIHHHPDLHHKPKPWKEYFLEFLMIFLAVTMGFFAESYRERLVNNEKEHQFMESLVEDLKNDLSELNSTIPFHYLLLNKMDSALKIQVESIKDIKNQHTFYNQFVFFYSCDIQFIPHDKTLSQLKNSGGYSLIRNKAVLDSLGELNLFYEQDLKFDGDYYYNYENKIIDIGAQVMKMSPLRSLTDTLSNAYPDSMEIFTTYDLQKLEQLYSWIRNLRYALDVYISNELAYQKRVGSLRDFIIKEYRLKND